MSGVSVTSTSGLRATISCEQIASRRMVQNERR